MAVAHYRDDSATAEYIQLPDRPHRGGRHETVVLANDLFFIAREERGGRSRLNQRALGLGLAGAMLGELVLAGQLGIDDDRLYVVNTSGPPDHLARHILGHILQLHQYRQVRVWLAYLAEYSIGAVGNRLAESGLVQVVERRRFLRHTELDYVPTSGNDAVWPEIRLRAALVERDRIDVADVVLGGLVEACGLLRHVLYDQTAYRVGTETLHRMLPRTPPPLQRLIAHTEAAVGDAVLAPR